MSDHPAAQQMLPQAMTPVTQYVLRYDQSFSGFLTAVFVAYQQRLLSVGEFRTRRHIRILKSTFTEVDMFAHSQDVETDDQHAGRVLARLEQCLGKGGVNQLIRGFLTEDDAIETCLLAVIDYALAYPSRRILSDYTHPDVLTLAKWLKSVHRERHRMTAFVRFEQMHNGIYFARIEPDFNVLPLIQDHFLQRYQDQQWAIYDLRRQYGIYYNLDTVETIVDVDPQAITQPSALFSDDERQYQQLWQGYFTHTNIKERRNQRLHQQHVPKRYWKYLTEKVAK